MFQTTNQLSTNAHGDLGIPNLTKPPCTIRKLDLGSILGFRCFQSQARFSPGNSVILDGSSFHVPETDFHCTRHRVFFSGQVFRKSIDCWLPSGNLTCEWRTQLLSTCNGHGQSGWSPIGCECFRTNLHIPCPLPTTVVFRYSPLLESSACLLSVTHVENGWHLSLFSLMIQILLKDGDFPCSELFIILQSWFPEAIFPRISQSSSILDWDIPLQTIQLLGYPHGHGNHQIHAFHPLNPRCAFSNRTCELFSAWSAWTWTSSSQGVCTMWDLPFMFISIDGQLYYRHL